jgi:phosphoheptose isomerase
MKYLDEAAEVMRATQAENVIAIQMAIAKIAGCAGTIYIIGNGGSLTTAEHFALDLRKYAKVKRAWALGSAAMITAIANDETFAFVFSAQLSDIMSADDLLIAFTFSACSRNIASALAVAQRADADRILITGPQGEIRRAQVKMATLAIFVPSENIRIVEDVHLAIAHCIAQGVREIAAPSTEEE